MSEPSDFVEGVIPENADIFDPAVLEEIERLEKQAKGTIEDSAVRMLTRRREAYARVFSAGNREQADIDIVLTDLMYFCKVWVPTFNIQDGQHADILSRMKDGRREVFQRIKDFSLLDSDALLLKYTDATTK